MKVEFSRSPLIHHVISKLRDKQTNSKDFRIYLRKLGVYLAYECSKEIESVSKAIITPVAKATARMIDEQIVVLSLLRAAMPMAEAVLDEFDNASLGMISASREQMLDKEGKEFTIKGGYNKIPELTDKTVIIVDPMLASGSTIKYLMKLVSTQNPKKVILLVAIASKFGINEIERNYPKASIYAGEIDEELNSHGYIVPGLGDAGDRVYNTS